MISFNRPISVGTEMRYMNQVIENGKTCGDGPFTKRCNRWIENQLGAYKALLTTSGSSALDMAALLCNLEPGDEVILPSFTFSSTANAFILAGAKLVFVDIRPDTMNIDEKKIEEAITDRTRVICVVHYAGVSCEMDTIMEIARRHNLLVVEDAAQAVMSTYKGRALGTIGDFGCLSFHETKNYSMGEGGAILINQAKDVERAEILREKGTNRSKFFRGQVDKYTWVDFGDSYLPSEFNAAYLWSQLEVAELINKNRLKTWAKYYELLFPINQKGIIDLPHIPDKCVHNAHMFYIKVKDIDERTSLIQSMAKDGVMSVFHYIPLHSSPAGKKFGRMSGIDVHTTKESERLTRLPMYYNLAEQDINKVVESVRKFFG